MSYNVHAGIESCHKTSVVSGVFPQTALQPRSRIAAAALLCIALSTSTPSPTTASPFESATSTPPAVRRSVFPLRETEREDLRAIARVRSLATYKDGWDGSGSIAPSRTTIEHAEEFLRYLFNLGVIDVPYISASSDGEINFFWKKNSLTLDLGFTGDGYYSYYASFPDGAEIVEDAAALNDPLPKEITNLIIR